MYKQIIALIRGQSFEAVAQVTERHALTILDQQIRDAAAAISHAKRALAVAIAEDAQEKTRLEAMAARQDGLEARAVAALQGGREDLALEAAGAIAELQADRETAESARAAFGREISQLRDRLKDAERRFGALHRGRRLARVGEAVRRSRQFDGALAVSDAEETLAALRERQILAAAADDALVSATNVSEAIEEKLGQAGFGARRPDAEAILARLKTLASIEAANSTST
jgi:phage shock protein A